MSQLFRRIFSISLILGFLLVSSLLLARTSALALTLTPTPMPTSPAEFIGAPLTGPAPLTVQFTHIGNNGPVAYCVWTFADGVSQTFSAIAAGSNLFPSCPSVSHTYLVPGKFSPALNALTNNGNPQGSKTNFEYVQVSGPTPTATPTNNPVPDLKAFSLFYANSNPPCPNNPRVSISIGAGGAAVNTPFQVTFNGETQTINSIGVNQGVSLDFNGVGGTKTVVVDSTNVIAETDESNNSMTFTVPSLTQCGGPSLTPTTTLGASPTRTNTPTGPTATHTPTQTVGASNTPIVPTSTRTNTPLSPTTTRTNTPAPPTATPGGSDACASPTVITGGGSFAITTSATCFKYINAANKWGGMFTVMNGSSTAANTLKWYGGRSENVTSCINDSQILNGNGAQLNNFTVAKDSTGAMYVIITGNVANTISLSIQNWQNGTGCSAAPTPHP